MLPTPLIGYATGTAISTMASQIYELVLLDLGLPGKDGLQVLNSIRSQANPVPVLIITARDGVEDRLLGLTAALMTTCSNPSRCANCWLACGR